ncbi:hypothetical protein NIES2119_25735 [[Phormidium ambiguum] IAM M-71]|uniref:Uncharacterized protein n=1 Tax=[Phormidium ambiguum] IAM M-71 TaxID=454136 RepID=A0A1U7I7Y4_9CYAN|nr:hypothetical protein [Phormidium ambiguum]OKH32544.1 hypothetical protein NIES2119_25735 [Phormidium ambiguum IAM M-71]
MSNKTHSSIWTQLDFKLVERRIRQINKWFEPFSNHESHLSLEDSKDSQTKSSELDISRK